MFLLELKEIRSYSLSIDGWLHRNIDGRRKEIVSQVRLQSVFLPSIHLERKNLSRIYLRILFLSFLPYTNHYHHPYTMKAATAVLFAVACATSTANGANLRSSAGVGEVARLMGRNTMYTGVVDMLRKEAPATAILKKLDSMKAVLKDRRAQVTEGCAIDNRHFEGDYEIAKGNVTEVSALVESKKMCVEHSTKKENEASEILAKTLKGLIAQSKFAHAKQRLEQIRARAALLVGEHKSRTERYNKEAAMFKAQDKILTHVMSTIENYYKHKSEASKKGSPTVQTVLLETVAPKSKAHHAVVTQLLEIVSKKTTPKKKILAGQIYEAMQDLKNTFEDERTKRGARYEARKGEHAQEIERLTAEEAQINGEVKGYLATNTKVTATAEGLKKEIAEITEKIVACKKAMTEGNKKFTSMSAQMKTKETAMKRTKDLCAGQLKDIDKEVQLAEHIIQLIDKRVHHIQQALVKYEKEANAETGMTGMATGAVGDLEKQIKSSEDCAKYSKDFWCASEQNMKQCGVDAEQCRLMNKNSMTTSFATGATGAATGPVGATAVAAATKKEHDFNRVLRVFDQNKDQKIGIKEIEAVKGKAVADKVRPVFDKSAGPDGKMDKQEFQTFMNGGKKFFFF